MRQRRKQQQKEERRARKQALAAAIASMEAGGLREPFTGLPQEQGAPGGSASAGSSSSASGALALAGQVSGLVSRSAGDPASLYMHACCAPCVAVGTHRTAKLHSRAHATGA
jgi:hypothetical protein